MGRLCVYVDFTRVFDVCDEKSDGLCTFMWYHRGFCMILVRNLGMSMFMWRRRGFRYVFPEFPTKFRLQLMAQMRSAGKFASIVHRCPRAICLPHFTHAGVYAISRWFSWCFHNMFAQILHRIRTDVRFTGDFTSIWRRCLGTFPLPDCALMMFHGFVASFRRQIDKIPCLRHSPLFCACFESIATPISAQNCGADAFPRAIYLHSA